MNRQIENLRQMRDRLPPRLLSGQVLVNSNDGVVTK
jgi:hypothetical protein